MVGAKGNFEKCPKTDKAANADLSEQLFGPDVADIDTTSGPT
jgi:hypothetical protein